MAWPKASFGAWLVVHGKAEQGITELNRALKLKPDFAFAYYWLGDAYRALHRLAEAVEAYKQGLAIKPDAGTFKKLAQLLAGEMERPEEGCRSTHVQLLRFCALHIQL